MVTEATNKFTSSPWQYVSPSDGSWRMFFLAELVLLPLGLWKLIELLAMAWRHFAAVCVLMLLLTGCVKLTDTVGRPAWVRAIESGDYSGYDHVGDFIWRNGQWVPVHGAPPPKPVRVRKITWL